MAPDAVIPFSVSPRAVHIVGQAPPSAYTSDDLEAARKTAHRQGFEEASKAGDAKISAIKSDVAGIQTKTLDSISTRFEQAVGQMRAVLPLLVTEAAARLVSKVQFTPEVVSGIVEDLLQDVAPGSDLLEVQLCEEDLQKMEQFQPQFRQKFPSIDFKVSPELLPGDCMVRTRFGVLDGRMETKLKSLESLLR